MTLANPAIAASLAKWHQMVSAQDLTALPSLLHPDAQFRSPMAFKPYQSAQAVALILMTVSKVFSNFRYHREFTTADGRGVVLEFSASIGDRQLKGVDAIQFDESGKIVDFEVMVRPFNALQALGEEMGKRLGALLPAYKAAQPAR
jgi:2,4-dienoyl-CoA reductase (NADPH2)